MSLVLTRKENQSIQINGDITVTVVETHSGKVKLAIDAPDEVHIVRAELQLNQLGTDQQ